MLTTMSGHDMGRAERMAQRQVKALDEMGFWEDPPLPRAGERREGMGPEAMETRAQPQGSLMGRLWEAGGVDIRNSAPGSCSQGPESFIGPWEEEDHVASSRSLQL